MRQSRSIPTGQLTVQTKYDTKFNNGVVSLSHVFAPSLINELKFGVNQTIYHTANVSPLPFGVSVSGFSSLTGSSTTDYPSKSFDLIDNLSWAKGRHVIKFGFETRWILLNQGTSQSGTLTYNSTAAFETNNMGSATYTAILPLVRQRKTQYFGYVQDEWKATANLTVTAGVRYNFFNALHAINNDDVPFDFGTCGGYCPNTDSFFHPRYDDFDPRLGIAWVAWQHGSARGSRHLPHGWPGRRPEPSDLQYRRTLHLQQHAVPGAFLSFDSVSCSTRKPGGWASLPRAIWIATGKTTTLRPGRRPFRGSCL